jgi:FtsZ-binding cell division protein ZapB
MPIYAVAKVYKYTETIAVEAENIREAKARAQSIDEETQDLRKEVAMLREQNSILMEQAGAARAKVMLATNECDFWKRRAATLQDHLDTLRKDGLAF